MKEIKLTQGKFAQVDDWNYDRLNESKWYAFKKKYTYYAVRFIYFNNSQKSILMHREIMNTPIGLECDHEDHNGLNCLEENLRNCTHSENQKNRRPSVNGTSKYLGVSYSKAKKKYRADISLNNNDTFLGAFSTETEAALAYNEAAKKYHGEFANLNFK